MHTRTRTHARSPQGLTTFQNDQMFIATHTHIVKWTNTKGEQTELSHVHQLHLCVSTVIHENCDLIYSFVCAECDKSTRLCRTYLSHQTFNNTRCFISTHDSVCCFFADFGFHHHQHRIILLHNNTAFVCEFEHVCNRFGCLLSKNGIDFLLLISADWSYFAVGVNVRNCFLNNGIKHVFDIMLTLH